MSGSLLIRAARAEDAGAVVDLVGRLDRFDPGSRTGFTMEEFLRHGLGDGAAFHTYLAEVDGMVRGYAIYYWGYDPHSATRGIYLADLYVEPAYRGRGAGKSLVSEVARQTREEGARWMFWMVRKGDRAARRFYRTLAPELTDIAVCAAFQAGFDRIASMGGTHHRNSNFSGLDR